jgi:hypothetical protein
MLARRPIWVSAVTLAVGLVVAPGDAPAEDAAPCNAFEIEYTLAANLTLRDTPMGEGNGTYTIGPGQVVLRFENRGGAPGGAVQMLGYSMREYFVINSKTLFWTTSVTTDTNTASTPNKCAVTAEGVVSGRTLSWRTPLRGYHTDGTLNCQGSLCGKFGAPPPGQSELHIPPGPVLFGAFELSADTKTFTMSPTQVAKTEMPKQTSFLGLAGRETRRTCVQVPQCKAPD